MREQKQNSLRLRAESLTHEPGTSPVEDIAAIADGAIELEDFTDAQQDSINKRFGPLVLGDVICYEKSERPLPFVRNEPSTAYSPRRIWVAIAAMLAIAAGGGLLVTVLQTRQAPSPPLATERQPTRNPVAPSSPQNQLPEFDPTRRAIIATPETVIEPLQVPISELPSPPIPGTCVVRSGDRFRTPSSAIGGYTVFGVIKHVDRDSGFALIVVSGRVSAWVEANDSPVRAGDPLAFSSMEGMLRRAGKEEAVVAVAIGEIEDGTDLIKVVIE